MSGFVSRRDWLCRAGGGIGAIALACLLDRDGSLRAFDPTPLPPNPLQPRKPHHPARAERVISLFMDGGPSHIDLFDPKPELNRRAGETLPDSDQQQVEGGRGARLVASRRKFRKCGEAGIELADWLPALADVADDLAVVRSCHADSPEHVQAIRQMHTGSIQLGKASLGAWAVYGLGSVSQDLPGFVVMTDGGEPTGGTTNWGPGILPAAFQGTPFRAGTNPVPHLNPPAGVTPARQKAKLELIRALNDEHLRERSGDDALAARIHAYEVAFRMQSAAPRVADLREETEATKKLYGIDRPESAEFGRRCLTARRLIEHGVRFVQIYCGAGARWDAHADLDANHGPLCARFDRPMAGLIRDLKQRGLLDSTLVIWGGEFGRTPTGVSGTGRDHNPYGFTTVLAGGGVKSGQAFGATDELGLRAVHQPVHVHDLHATILHLLGFDHTRLAYVHSGRLERLTGNGGHVVSGLVS
jgi:uncharacterized protein (DUF1501 family)